MKFPKATTTTQLAILGITANESEEVQTEFVDACAKLSAMLANYVPRPGVETDDMLATRCLALAFVMDDIAADIQKCMP